MKFRKKPVVIEAIQWNGSNYKKIKKFIGTSLIGGDNSQLLINTLEGNHTANKNDWIIKGVRGEFYPCKPDIFEETYNKIKFRKK